MTDELTPDEEAILHGLDSLFEPRAEDQPVPRDFATALKRQVRDRLEPDRLTFGETAALTLLGVVALGLVGVHSWGAWHVPATAVAVWIFVRAAHWLGTAHGPQEE